MKKTAPKLPQHENLLSYGSLSTKIKIPRCGPRFINFPKTVPCEVNLALQCSHLEVLLLSKFGSRWRILIFVDDGPKGYKLSCCGSFGLVFFQFYSDCPWPYCGYSTLHSVSQDWKFQLSLAILRYDKKNNPSLPSYSSATRFFQLFFYIQKVLLFSLCPL